VSDSNAYLARIATALEALAVSADATRPEAQLLNVVREVGASAVMNLKARRSLPGAIEHAQRHAEVGSDRFDVRVTICYLGKL